MSIDITNSAICDFQSSDRLELLNDIDRFRQHGLDNLPQIVVCGDTSSGKSSVLEALSGIPFPTDSALCTRYATAISLRYAAHTDVTGYATITPKSTGSHNSRCLNFKQQITSLDSIPDLMRDAEEAMGIVGSRGISRDILHLNLYGSRLPNLTLVDIPGIIHFSPNKDDIASVKDLVKSHFEQRNSIILTVVSAENPIKNQEVLSLSRECDPTGTRSIGVITKADLLNRPDKIGLRTEIIELAENRYTGFSFKRPWHVVRCLNSEERAEGKDRKDLEKALLDTSPWNQLPLSQRGIRSLQLKLSDYLQEHISQVLPGLAQTLEQKKATTTSSLERLGPTRVTARDQMHYLSQLSSRYNELVKAALQGDYSDSFFRETASTNRLRSTTMALTDNFVNNMQNFGHTFEIEDGTQPSQGVSGPVPPRFSRAAVLRLVEQLMVSNRGPELPGLYNPGLVTELFKELSTRWSSLVEAYTAQILEATALFLRRLIHNISPADGRTADLILRHIFEDAIEELQGRLRSKLKELFEPYQGFFLFAPSRRLEASLRLTKEQLDDTGSPSLESKATELLRFSMAYYRLALENFVDNVVVLGVEACLLSKLEGMFEPQMVIRMSEEMLQLLGGESPEMLAERDNLQAQLQTLDKSLGACYGHIGRFGLRSESLGFAAARATSPAATEQGPVRPIATEREDSARDEAPNATPVKLETTTDQTKDRSQRDGSRRKRDKKPTTAQEPVSSFSSYGFGFGPPTGSVFGSSLKPKEETQLFSTPLVSSSA